MIEYRNEDGNLSLTGVVVRYNEQTDRTVFGKEKILPGAFGAVEKADIVLNSQHDRTQPLARSGEGGLRLIDSYKELRAEVQLPNTRAAQDAYELVKRKILRGFSVEMYVQSDRVENDVRVISGAKLMGLGLVDKPAYRMSRAEVREDEEEYPIWVL